MAGILALREALPMTPNLGLGAPPILGRLMGKLKL